MRSKNTKYGQINRIIDLTKSSLLDYTRYLLICLQIQIYIFTITEFAIVGGETMKKICILIMLLLHYSNTYNMNFNGIPPVTVMILPVPLGYRQPCVGTVYSNNTSSELSGFCITLRQHHHNHEQQQIHNTESTHSSLQETQTRNNQQHSEFFNTTTNNHDYHRYHDDNDDNHETSWFWRCIFCECCLWLCCRS